MMSAVLAAGIPIGFLSSSCAKQLQRTKRKIKRRRILQFFLAGVLLSGFISGCTGYQNSPFSSGPRVLTLDPLDAASVCRELIGLVLEQAEGSSILTIEFLDLSRETPIELYVNLGGWPINNQPRDLQLQLSPDSSQLSELQGQSYSPNFPFQAEWDFDRDRVEPVPRGRRR